MGDFTCSYSHFGWFSGTILGLIAAVGGPISRLFGRFGASHLLNLLAG